MRELITGTERFRVEAGASVDLAEWITKDHDFKLGERESRRELHSRVDELALLQHRLHAEGKQSVLLVFQGMDASGKDSTIRRVTTGLNPAGVQVTAFAMPTQQDLEQSYLQRHWRYLPSRGKIGIHNRSHYEEVIVTRVHPSLLRLRGVQLKDVDGEFWQQRFADIRAFERHLALQSHTTVVKFFLHISKGEQRKRLLARLDDPEKNWKFDNSDIRERLYWDDYQAAYGDAIAATSTDVAPWYVIPGDQKRFARLAVAEVLAEKLAAMDPQFPEPATDLESARHELLRT